jgi:hypothetical protein
MGNLYRLFVKSLLTVCYLLNCCADGELIKNIYLYSHTTGMKTIKILSRRLLVETKEPSVRIAGLWVEI